MRGGNEISRTRTDELQNFSFINNNNNSKTTTAEQKHIKIDIFFLTNNIIIVLENVQHNLANKIR